MDLKTINFFDDYDRNTGLRTYNFDLLADYTVKEFVSVCDDNNNCLDELRDVNYTRYKVVLKLGDASIYVTAELDTDLKIEEHNRVS